MTSALHCRPATLSLLSIDPYWRSQLLVEYSKDIFSCRILDGQLLDGRYTLRDGVIYYQSRIFLTRASKLKGKLLHAKYEVFLSSHTDFMRAYHTIMEGFTWEGFKEEINQHIRRCMDYLEIEERHNSLEELSQPLPFSFGMRGGPYTSHFTNLLKAYGKDFVSMHNNSLT